MRRCNLTQKAVLLISCLFVLAALPMSAIAQDSVLINYQGMLADTDGAPVTGTPLMLFQIYDASGDVLWLETHAAVTVNDGMFSVVLGSQTALPDSIFSGEVLYLGITVGADDEIAPRTQLTSTPGSATTRRVNGDIRTSPGVLQIVPPDPCVPPEPCIPVRLELHPPEPCEPLESCTPAIVLEAASDTNTFVVHPPDPCVPPDPCTPAIELGSGLSSAGIVVQNMPVDGGGKSVGISTNESDAGIIIVNNQPTGDSSAVGISSGESEAGIIIVNNSEVGTSSSVDIGADASQAGIIIVNNLPTGDSSAVGISTGESEAGIIIINNSEGGVSSSVDITTGLEETGIIVVDSKPGEVEGTDSTTVKLGIDLDENGIIVVDSKPGGDAGSSSVKLSTDLEATGIIVVDSKPGGAGGDSTAVSMQTSLSEAELTLFKGDSSEEADIVFRVNSDGGRVGINTNSPSAELYVDGDIVATGAITEISSEKYKTNINPLSDALELVDDLRGVEYQWRTEDYPDMQFSSERQIGLIAEEVETVVPELVRSDENGEKSVNYSKLTAVLIEAVKDLKAQNEELRTRLEALEKK